MASQTNELKDVMHCWEHGWRSMDGPCHSIDYDRKNYAAKRHRARTTRAPPIRALGSFEGGELKYWHRDQLKIKPEQLREEDGQTFDVKSKFVALFGKNAHEVLPFVASASHGARRAARRTTASRAPWSRLAFIGRRPNP